MTFIALDDEPLALMLIEKLALEIQEAQLVGTFTDPGAVADFLQKNTVDLLISDINMPDISGLQFVRDLPYERPMVVFLTAYKDHALESFDLDVIDYLIKPVSLERFRKAINKALDRFVLNEKAARIDAIQAQNPHFFVFSEYQQVKIMVRDILYVEGMGDYVKIHLENQTRPILTLERVKNLAIKLEKQGFRRIHRSFLVNLEKVTAKQKSQVRIGETWIPVGETYANKIGES